MPRNKGMKSAFLSLLFAGVFLAAAAQAAADRPNIIFVLADDLGWAELGCYGNSFHETPHLDRLAAEGVRYTHAYAAAPVCSPYRAALLTGKHPIRLGITDYLRPNTALRLPEQENTLAERLQTVGYSTGMVGKWHLTGYAHHGAKAETRPTDHGFDFNIGSEVKGVGNGANFWPYRFRTQPIIWIDLPENKLGPDEYLTDRLNHEACDFIRRSKDKPFFLYLAHYAPHTILNGRPDLVEKYRKKHAPGTSDRDNCNICKDAGLKGDAGHHWAQTHNPHLAAMLESIDAGIGDIRKTLAELGIEKNTMIIFSSDNGGETNVTSNKPLRGGKSQLYEGGNRVPLIAHWPARGQAGKVSELRTVNTDLLPTLLDAAGAPIEDAAALDGQSILSSVVGKADPEIARSLHWHYLLDKPHFLGGRSGTAILHVDWKLIEFFDQAGGQELYNLADDPGEETNLAANHSDRVAALRKRHHDWLQPRLRASGDLEDLPAGFLFADDFEDGADPRWWFSPAWEVKDGALIRNQQAGENQRIFLRDVSLRNARIELDVAFRGAQEIRILTGAEGHYNSVVHLHPTDLFIQTARDEDSQHLPSIQGERGGLSLGQTVHRLQIDFQDDEMIVSLDGDTVRSAARHPIINRERDYFAFQVDGPGAVFDNVRMWQTANHPDQAARWNAAAQATTQPITRSAEEQRKVDETNTRDRLNREDRHYKKLLKDIDAAKLAQAEQFPDVFASIKAQQKKQQAAKKAAFEKPGPFRDMQIAVHKAKQAKERWLFDQVSGLKDAPRAEQQATLGTLRKQHSATTPAFQALIKDHAAKEQALQTAFPQFFVSDKILRAEQKENRTKRKDDAEFQAVLSRTAAAVNAERSYVEAAMAQGSNRAR